MSGFDQQALARLRRKFLRLPRELRKSLRVSVEQGAEEVVAAQRRQAPKRRGKLRQAIGYEMSPEAETAAARIRVNYAPTKGPSAPHAHLVEFGTAPHVITSDKPMGVGGRLGYRVEHPGAAPHPFFYPTWRAYRSRVRGKITRAAKKTIKEIKRGG